MKRALGMAARGESRTPPKPALFRHLCVAKLRNTQGIAAVRRLDLTQNHSLSIVEHGRHGLLGVVLLASACSASAPSSSAAASDHGSLAAREDAAMAVAVTDPDAQPAPDAKTGPQCSTKTLEVGTEPLGYRATGQVCDGMRQGPWSFTYLDGQPHRQGAYLDDTETGPWVFWYHTGKKRSEGEFLRGQRVGQWIRNHSNGVLSLKGGYREGLRHGRWRRWHNTGQLYEDRIYQDGKREGLHRKWSVAGDLQYVRFCKNDNCTIECRVSGTKTCPDPKKKKPSKNSP